MRTKEDFGNSEGDSEPADGPMLKHVVLVLGAA